jgi:hypothetical protein
MRRSDRFGELGPDSWWLVPVTAILVMSFASCDMGQQDPPSRTRILPQDTGTGYPPDIIESPDGSVSPSDQTGADSTTEDVSPETTATSGTSDYADSGGEDGDTTREEDDTSTGDDSFDCSAVPDPPRTPVEDSFSCVWPGTLCDSIPEYACSGRSWCHELRYLKLGETEATVLFRCAECNFDSSLCPDSRPYCDFASWRCVSSVELPPISCQSSADCIPYAERGFGTCVPERSKCLPDRRECIAPFGWITSTFDEGLHTCRATQNAIDEYRSLPRADPSFWEADSSGGTEP